MPHSGRRGASQLTHRGVNVLRLAQQVGIRGRARGLPPERAHEVRCGFVINEAGRAPLAGQPMYSEEEPRE